MNSLTFKKETHEKNRKDAILKDAPETRSKAPNRRRILVESLNKYLPDKDVSIVEISLKNVEPDTP